MMYVANGHVRITGGRLSERIEAPNARKAADIGQRWAAENDLVFDGVETEQEHTDRTARREALGSGS